MDYIQAAEEIANRIYDLSISSDDDNLWWISEQEVIEIENTGIVEEQTLIHNLGNAVFFAGLANVTNSLEWAEISYSSSKFFFEAMEEDHEHIIQNIISQGGKGLGSLIYGVILMGDLLKDSNLHMYSGLLAIEITKQKLSEHPPIEIDTGISGTLLALCKAYESTNKVGYLQKAIICGDYLLSRRSTSTSGKQSWKNQQDNYTVGYRLGSSGIAYSLVRLYSVSKNLAYLEAAFEAFDFERAVEDFENAYHIGNDRSHNLISWSNIGTGIGISRVGCLPYLKDKSRIIDDIDLSISMAKEFNQKKVDHLYKGNFDSIELLQLAGLYLNNDDCLQLAHDWAREIIEFQVNENLFSELDIPTPNNQYDLCQGAAGIGYQCLRMAEPKIIPSTLLRM